MIADTNYYPIFLDLRGRPCLVVGGGEIATRQVEGLLIWVSHRTVTGTVETIADLANRYRFRTPTVIVVGKVVSLGRELQQPSHQTHFDYESSRYEVTKNSVEFQVL